MSPSEKKKYKEQGIDVDAIEKELHGVLSPQSTNQSGTEINNQTQAAQQAEGILPYATSAGIGALKSGLAMSSPFLPQTAYQFGSGLTNLLTNKLIGKEFLPSYEQLQENIPTIQGAEQDALRLMKEYGLIPKDQEVNPVLPKALLKPFPTAEQVVGKGQE